MGKIIKLTRIRGVSRLLFLVLFCFASLIAMQAQNKTVTGTVLDSNNEPLIGVNIIIKGVQQGTATDIDGKFSISVDNTNAVLVFRYVGFQVQEVRVGNRTVIEVVMKDDAEVLREVVVIGFGSQKKENLTAAVSRVDKEVFENRPIATMGQALKGIVPGLNVGIPTGAPNEIPKINIRGATAIKVKSGKDKSLIENYEVVSGSPLLLVDGVEVTEVQFNQLNPNDVDNVSFLKDASAAAIYGTRATFGVVIVTTKSGNFEQAPSINYSYSIGWDKPAATPDILNSYQIMKMNLDKSMWTGKINPSEENLKKLAAMQTYMQNPTFRNSLNHINSPDAIDWVATMNPFDVALKNWTPTQKHNASVSGGGKNISYHVSLGMMDQDGMYKLRNDDFKRYNASASINAKVAPWMNLTAKVSLNQTKYYTPHVGTDGCTFKLPVRKI